MLQLLPCLLSLAVAGPVWHPQPMSKFVLQGGATLRSVDSVFLSLSLDRRKRKRPLEEVRSAPVGKGPGDLWLVGSSFDSGGLTYLAQKQKDGWVLRGVYDNPPTRVLPEKRSFRLAWDTSLSGRRFEMATRPYDGSLLPPPERFLETGARPTKSCESGDPVCGPLTSSVLLEGTSLESRACAQKERFQGIACAAPTTGDEVRTMVWKPMIYLYPSDTLDVSVTMGRPERVATSYPRLVGGGWKVRAYPGGDLVSKESGKRYYGLFWEGLEWNPPVSDTGYCFRREDFGAKMDSILEIKGLDYREREEFVTFWISRISHRFVAVRFPESEFSKAFPVVVEPAPELFLRVFATFEQSDVAISLIPPRLAPIHRPGWTAVEWGGQEIGGR